LVLVKSKWKEECVPFDELCSFFCVKLQACPSYRATVMTWYKRVDLSASVCQWPTSYRHLIAPLSWHCPRIIQTTREQKPVT